MKPAAAVEASLKLTLSPGQICKGVPPVIVPPATGLSQGVMQLIDASQPSSVDNQSDVKTKVKHPDTFVPVASTDKPSNELPVSTPSNGDAVEGPS